MIKKKSHSIGWMSFYDDAYNNFSESFKYQMGTQLEQAFNKLTGIDNFASKRDFLVLVGMDDLKLSYKDDFGFGVLALCTPHSQSVQQYFFWKTDNPKEAIQNEDLTKDNIQFGFCTDFEKDLFVSFQQRRKVRVIRRQKLQFQYIEELELYPDLSMTFSFKSIPSREVADHISSILNAELAESYVGNFCLENLSIGLDFQGTPYNKGKKQLRNFILKMNQECDSLKLTSIIVA